MPAPSRGFDEALTRLKAFVAEGADILFLDSPQTEAEMREAVAACNGKPSLAVTSPAGTSCRATRSWNGSASSSSSIRRTSWPATVHAVRAALGG
jgi:2-methylisocitrate lyase-like PEP mutase family enzyme